MERNYRCSELKDVNFMKANAGKRLIKEYTGGTPPFRNTFSESLGVAKRVTTGVI